jgi:outer membrane immunogenic protein
MTRYFFLFIAFVGLSVTSALADGMPAAPTNECCGDGPFAGAYIGASIGFGSQKVDVDNRTIGAAFSDEEWGFLVGGYAGYNWQHCCSHVVYGIEVDLNYLNASPTAVDAEPPGPAGLPETTTLRSTIDWFSTLRGRAGFVVHEDYLLYATGGLAFARVNHTLNDDCVGCGNTPFNLGPFSQSDSSTKFGWTAGGGIEYLHSSRWLLRAEALFVDLGSNRETYVVVNPAVGTAVADTRWDDQFWIGRFGLTYKFDGLWSH